MKKLKNSGRIDALIKEAEGKPLSATKKAGAANGLIDSQGGNRLLKKRKQENFFDEETVFR